MVFWYLIGKTISFIINVLGAFGKKQSRIQFYPTTVSFMKIHLKIDFIKYYQFYYYLNLNQGSVFFRNDV